MKQSLTNNYKRLPEYLKRPIAPINDIQNKKVREILAKYNLNTVCDSARCPNKSGCYGCLTATFLIMGNFCTRNCRFCNIQTKKPLDLNTDEPENVALAINELKLDYAVITSVTRDDLQDGGAMHFKNTVQKIRQFNPDIKIEILTPDFKGDKNALNTIISSKPDVFNHNIETVFSLYKLARPGADYKRSLEILSYIKSAAPEIITKTGIMVGLGETKQEIVQTFKDIKAANIDILTIGQYIRPSLAHLAVEKYYSENEFKNLETLALNTGISACISAPLARSSYRAKETYFKLCPLKK